jgi:hypothetical protein
MANYTLTRDDFYYANEIVENDPDLLMDSVLEASDGCSVEPDGVCPHGRPSPLLVLGMI